jgi:hypothetical protein
MSNIKFSAPFLRKFIHDDVTVNTSWVTALPAAEAPQRRVVVVIQNKSDTTALYVALNETSTEGLLVPIKSNVSLDNYNGIVRLKSDGSVVAHVAYATA